MRARTVPVREIHGPVRQTVDVNKPFEWIVDWDENVRFLHEAKLVLVCRRIRLEDNPATSHTHPVSGTTSSSESQHTHSVANHTHPLQYGIFEGSYPTTRNIGLMINGVDVTAALGGPWNPAENTPLVLDITQYLQEPDGRPKQQRNRLRISAGALLDVEVQLKSLIAIATVVPV